MRFLPIPPPSTSAFPERRAVGFGITWDPEWIAAGRLRIRGFRSVSAPAAITADEFDGLSMMTDDTLASAGWTPFEREAVAVALRRLYAADLAGWPRAEVISPGMAPSLELTPHRS